MKTNRLHRMSARALCFALSLFLWSAAQGQPKPADAPPAAATATSGSKEAPAATPTGKPPSAPDAAAPNPADADKVALNLRGANIDQVLSFLSELTGMPVMKQKDAKAQITIVNKDKVAKQDAIRMICEALRLDGTAVVMRDHIIWLVPENQVSSLDVGLTLEPGKLPQVGVVTKAIQVKLADVNELEKIIRPLLGKNATLIASPATRQLIITDAADRILNVERVLAQLDALDVDNRQVQIFQLHYADSEELAPILRAIMAPPPRANAGPGQPSPGQPGSAPPGPGQPGPVPPGPAAPGSAAKPVNDVEIQSYKAANWLVVVAPKEKLVKIAQLVAEMDQELTQEVKLRTIAVKYASAQDLARQLGDLVRKRYDKKVREVIEVASDQRSNTIVVLSSEQNFKALQTIVTQLDTEESLQTKTEWFELKHADAEDLAQQMNDLYEGMQQNANPFFFFFGGNRPPATRFVCEKRSNSLIAIAPPAEFERIRKLVERLDQVVDADQAAPRMYPIRHVDAKELADVLNKVFGVQDAKTVTHSYWENVQEVGGAKVGRLNGKVRFDPLISVNAIIVTTSNKENFPIIEGFLQRMDSALPGSSNLLVVVLKNAQATDMADQLNTLFGREGTKIPPKTPSPTPAQAQQGQQQQQQSQQPQPDLSLQGMFLTAQAMKDARPISDLIGRVRVVADVRTNALLITTVPENRDAVRDLVEALDVASPKVYVSVRLIEVSRTNASYVGVRYTSTPSLFSSADFDNGLQTNLGITWQTAFHNGLLTSTALTPAVLAQYILEHFDSRILSDTSLTMDNNRQGQIFVGSQIPILTNSAISNGFQNQGYTYQNVGTNLTMTPIINTENRVVMNINMQASQLEPGVTILGGAVIDTRTFTTILAVENNQTIVMGGIMSEQYVENIRRFPILGYIPVLDWIFAKKDKQRQVTEIIGFITPVVLRGPADVNEMTHKTEEGIKRRQEWPILPPEKGEPPDDRGVGGEMK